MRTFWVAALPRSGTCWLTNAINASCPSLLARHEAVGHYRDNWDNVEGNHTAIGSVGSDVLVPALIDFRRKDTTVFFLHREVDDVKSSLKKCGIWTEEGWERQVEWRSWFLWQPVVHIHYEKLDEAVKTVAEYMGSVVSLEKLNEAMLSRTTSRRWPDSI